jgi:hypothetical protein
MRAIGEGEQFYTDFPLAVRVGLQRSSRCRKATGSSTTYDKLNPRETSDLSYGYTKGFLTPHLGVEPGAGRA